jgi:hypothetical protein
LPENITITFPTIFLIEQDGSAPWQIFSTHRLSQ